MALLDNFVADGHIEKGIERIQSRIKYAQAPHLFAMWTKANFRKSPAFWRWLCASAGYPAAGPLLPTYDNDGDLDIVRTTNNGPAVLLRNDGGSTNHSLRLRLAARAPTETLGAVCVSPRR